MTSKKKRSSHLAFAKQVIKAYLMYSKGYPVARISESLGVTIRMAYYYLERWNTNPSYYVKLIGQQSFLSKFDINELGRP